MSLTWTQPLQRHGDAGCVTHGIMSASNRLASAIMDHNLVHKQPYVAAAMLCQFAM
jgi:hypothetical protein